MQLKSRDIDEPSPPPREYPSVVPGSPRLTEDTFQDYYIYWAACVVLFLIFGGLIAPLAEVKMGLGGTTYLDFIESVHLPRQLALVDPIVALSPRGAVGAHLRVFRHRDQQLQGAGAQGVHVLQGDRVPDVCGVQHEPQARADHRPDERRQVLLPVLQRDGEGDVHQLPVHGHGDGDGARPEDRSVRGVSER